jgi:hypothetical protein
MFYFTGPFGMGVPFAMRVRLGGTPLISDRHAHVEDVRPSLRFILGKQSSSYYFSFSFETELNIFRGISQKKRFFCFYF